MIQMTINGVDVTELHLIPLKGTVDNIMKPAEKKSLVFNDNATIDGSLAITTNRKTKRRDVSLLFLMSSVDIGDLYNDMQFLDTFLLSGVDDTGVNELRIQGINAVFRLVYNKMDKYSGFGETKASVSLSFTELDPTNRDV